MKWIKRILYVCVTLAVIGLSLAEAQNAPHGYTCLDTSVTSNSTPTAIATPGQITTWLFQNSATPGSDVVLVFPYTGNAVPTAKPSPAGALEIASGALITDAITCSDASCKEAMGQGWAAVLQTGSTATTMHVCTR